MGETSADRAAVAHLEVSDIGRTVGDRGERRAAELCRFDQLAPRRQRAEVKRVITNLHVTEREPSDVDHERRPGDPELHDRKQ